MPHKPYCTKIEEWFKAYLPFVYCLLAVLILPVCMLAQVKDYPKVYTPINVAVNRTLPKNVTAPGEVMQAKFSKEPTDEEIYRAHFFEEPLVPAGGEATAEENNQLIYALAGFSQRKSEDDFSSITQFLRNYPKSRWQGALLANLGIVYRRTGYYNEAMKVWDLAWMLLKNQKEHQIKVLADRVVSELLLINSWVGRAYRIEELLKEIDRREIEGPAVERVSAIRSALWTMKNKPGISFKCGPYALNKIFTLQDSTKPFNEEMMDVQSTSKGFSLTQLKQMADEIGLKYQIAFRTPGAELIIPAVIHWKLDHYSTLLTKENGQYKCQDATMGTAYGQEFWLTAAALDSSASGYFLVPDSTLPVGWRKVTPAESDKIFGKGLEPTDQGKHVSPQDKQLPEPCPETPMAQCNVHAQSVSLHIYDQPVYYSPPKGPAMLWSLDYHQRDSYQPANFSYSNMGPKWTFNWLSYVQDNPNILTANANVYVMGGGTRTFESFNAATQRYTPEVQTRDVLVRICPTCYELRHPDGSKEVYARPDGNTSSGRKIFMTKKIDAAGNELTIAYDANLRVVALSDALGQVTTIGYENSDIYKITKVTDPFGRFAAFQYDVLGRLIKITDMIGILSSFNYEGNTDFINGMTTPYGATSFKKTEGPSYDRSLETSYPLNEKERVEYKTETYEVSFNERKVPESMSIYNQNLVWRNTFYWDKMLMKTAPGDYTKAKLYHWLHGSSSSSEYPGTAPQLESVRESLENRVWYNYQSQSHPSYVNKEMSAGPSKIGRILDNDTTQLYQYTYNDLGAVTSSIDPAGRKFTYVYDTNNVDLLEVRQTRNNSNELLAKFTYNNQHLPLTAVDASGLITTYTYNAAGQLKTVTNPKKQTTTLLYNVNGYLDSIAGPVTGSTISFGYDGYGRVRTVTDREGYTIITDYDALNRPTIVTYPDSTFEQTVYDRLDAVYIRDRMGRWSHTIYDSLDRPNVIEDALGKITQLIWCSCGSLSEIIDPLKQVTSFVRDDRGRIIAKRHPDGKGTIYKYENTTSRLKEITDAKGQKTQYSYLIDNNLRQRNYENASVATPSVAFTYDSAYNRVKTMTDGTGTTVYNYTSPQSGLGSNMLTTIDGPLANDLIGYSYDSLSRISRRSINGTISSVIYDTLGRVVSETNALGNFIYRYLNQTNRLSSISSSNGQNTIFDYYDNPNDQRLKQIHNKAADGTTLSKFDYNYSKEGMITKWAKQTNTSTPSYYDLSYDLTDQLVAATQKNQANSSILKRYAYRYDKAGNRTSEQIDNSVTSAIYNDLNQLTKQQESGPMYFKGTLSEFASVQVKNQSTSDSVIATVDTTNSFEAFIKVLPGANDISVTATDYSGNNNTSTNNYTVTVSAGANNTFAFDKNGNTISSTAPAVTYDWDVEDRLVKIIQGASITEFVYDGLSRRVAEKLNGTITKRWIWDGSELSEERDGSGVTVTKRFFKQGEQINGINYFFTKDHLGSIREMVAADGVNVITQYDYDPYGRRTKMFGSIEADFGFTGHYYHAFSKLHMAMFRAYDGNLGRWLSRDLIAESGGSNFYRYVHNNSINVFDPLGLIDEPGFLEGFIPVWGSGRQALHDFECGNWGWGLFNAGMAGLDIFGGVSLLKGGWKLGAHGWKATRAWLGRRGFAEKGQQVHHAIVEQKYFRGTAGESVFNQPWNLKPLNPPEGIDANTWHRMVEGKEPGLTSFGRWWEGMPDWAKAAETSAAGKAANAARNAVKDSNCDCK